MRLEPRISRFLMIAVTVTSGILAIGVGLVTLSTLGAHQFSQSYCVLPNNASAASPNCFRVETVAQPLQGPYSELGPIGAILILSGAVGTPILMILAGLFSLISHRKRYSKSKSRRYRNLGEGSSARFGMSRSSTFSAIMKKPMRPEPLSLKKKGDMGSSSTH